MVKIDAKQKIVEVGWIYDFLKLIFIKEFL